MMSKSFQALKTPKPQSKNTDFSVISPNKNYTPSIRIVSPEKKIEPVSFRKWTCQQVVDWLQSLGLQEYGSKFVENSITGEELPELQQEDLEELGVEKVGHRLRIIQEIHSLISTYNSSLPPLPSISPSPSPRDGRSSLSPRSILGSPSPRNVSNGSLRVVPPSPRSARERKEDISSSRITPRSAREGVPFHERIPFKHRLSLQNLFEQTDGMVAIKFVYNSKKKHVTPDVRLMRFPASITAKEFLKIVQNEYKKKVVVRFKDHEDDIMVTPETDLTYAFSLLVDPNDTASPLKMFVSRK